MLFVFPRKLRKNYTQTARSKKKAWNHDANQMMYKTYNEGEMGFPRKLRKNYTQTARSKKGHGIMMQTKWCTKRITKVR
jgi:hypothetical protein